MQGRRVDRSSHGREVVTKDQLLLLAVLIIGIGGTTTGITQAVTRPRKGVWFFVAACGIAGIVLAVALLIT
jgi:hypothetical protein